jgi:hypothetical protein
LGFYTSPFKPGWDDKDICLLPETTKKLYKVQETTVFRFGHQVAEDDCVLWGRGSPRITPFAA